MCATSNTAKRGIALVVVLGFLSVLVLMAVTFAIVMRTERLASRNYNDQVRARQLVHAALARIIADHVRTAMGTNVYPPWDAIYSQYDGRPGPDFVSYPDSDGWPYVPMSLVSAANNANRAEWRPLRDPDPQDNRYYGEYAYLVVNNSGLLDANVIGAPGGRKLGEDPAEIRFSDLLPEFYRNTLFNYRTNFGRFESVPELFYLASSEAGEVQMIGVSRALKQLNDSPRSYADHLHVYSRYPRGHGGWDPGVRAWVANTNVAYIGGSTNEWRSELIEAALDDLSPNPIPDLTAFINALYDYADDGVVPRGNGEVEKFERISSKSVPMINEVIISNTFRWVLIGTNEWLQHRLYLTLETWYPFPRDANDVDPSYLVQHEGIPTARIQGYFPVSQLTQESPASPIPPHVAYDYRTSTVVYVQTRLVNGAGQPPFPPPVGTLLSDVRLPGNLKVTRAGNAVDLVRPTWPDQAFFWDAAQVPAIALDGPPGPFGTPIAFSVNDPRINWNPGDARQWVRTAPTLGGQNLRDDSWPEAPPDEFGHMYCRRGPIRSVGEVGYLLYDASRPWRTVRLMTNATLNPADPLTARILDRLTVHTNVFRQGLVNINTRQTNVTAAMFYHMPIEPYPGYSDGSTLTKDKAVALASYVVRTNNNATLGPQVNYSDVGCRWKQADMVAFVESAATAVATNKFWAESFVRNSIGLWGTRHNLFTVFLATRVFDEVFSRNPAAYSGSESNHVVGEQRAVAVLWRDPFQTKDQYGVSSHENFVRFFHWLVLLFED